MRLDALDLRIATMLQEDARLSLRQLAERLGSTTPTVSARVKALEDIGLLKGYHAHIDPAVLGGASHHLTVAVHPQSAAAAVTTLRQLPGLQSLHLLAGGRIVAGVHVRPPALSLSGLHETVTRLPGLVSYDLGDVVESHGPQGRPPLPEHVEVPCHQCGGPIHGEPVKSRLGDRMHVFCCRQCQAAFRERYESMRSGATQSGRQPA